MNLPLLFPRVCRCRIMRWPVVGSVLAWAVIFATGASATDRMWTSSMGSQIEATYVAKVGREHWLLEKTGRIIKLTADKLSPPDVKFLEATPVASDDWVTSGKIVSVTTADPAVAGTVEVLVGTKIPSFNVDKMELDEALRMLSDVIEKNDPLHRRVEFRLDPDFARQPASVSIRNLTGVRVLSFMFGGQSGPVSATISAGRVDLGPYRGPPPTLPVTPKK